MQEPLESLLSPQDGGWMASLDWEAPAVSPLPVFAADPKAEQISLVRTIGEALQHGPGSGRRRTMNGLVLISGEPRSQTPLFNFRKRNTMANDKEMAAGKRRMTSGEWATVRVKWETDPRTGYIWVVTEMGLSITSVAVLKRARKEGWTKKVILKNIVDRAQVRADENASGKSGFSGNAEAIDLRAGVIEKHRAEWDRHRELFTLEMILGDEGINAVRAAKTSAEMINIRQEGERKAWGLNATAEDTSSGVSTLDELETMFEQAVKQSAQMQEAVRKERSRLVDMDF